MWNITIDVVLLHRPSLPLSLPLQVSLAERPKNNPSRMHDATVSHDVME